MNWIFLILSDFCSYNRFGVFIHIETLISAEEASQISITLGWSSAFFSSNSLLICSYKRAYIASSTQLLIEQRALGSYKKETHTRIYVHMHIYIKTTFESSKDLQASAAAAFLVPFFSKTFLILGRTLDFQYPIFLLFSNQMSPSERKI